MRIVRHYKQGTGDRTKFVVPSTYEEDLRLADGLEKLNKTIPREYLNCAYIDTRGRTHIGKVIALRCNPNANDEKIVAEANAIMSHGSLDDLTIPFAESLKSESRLLPPYDKDAWREND